MFHPTRRDVLRIGLGALAGAALRSPACAAADKSDLVLYGSPRKFTITHRGVVTGGTVPMSSLELWLPVPQSGPEQEVGEVKLEPKVPLVPDTTGQALVARRYATTGFPKENKTWSLEVTYEITCRFVRANWPAIRRALLPDYRRDDAYKLFTRREKYIETDLPEIAEQAKKLRAEHRHPVSLVQAAYDWVLERTEYKLIEGIGGAGYCLKEGHGECGDYSALLVAVCRAAGVPARPVAGFWADKTDGWHVWAEFMLPGGEWLPVDASIGDQNRFSRQHCFGSTDNRRVAACKTLDVELTGKPLGQMKSDFLQSGCVWWYSHNLKPNARKPTVTFTVEGRPVGTPAE